jgi:hypothetical protein
MISHQWPKWILTAAVLLPVLYLYGPTWPDDPKRDDCSFGLVPNEKYQEFLAIAQRKIAAGQWAPISMWSWDPHPNAPRLYAEIEHAFRSRIEEITTLANSENERIAAIHAAARALGGRYEPRTARPTNYSFAVDKKFQFFLGYRFDARRLGNYLPLDRWRGLLITLTKTTPLQIGQITFGGVMGWQAPPYDLGLVFIQIPPPTGLCPPPFAENSN